MAIEYLGHKSLQCEEIVDIAQRAGRSLRPTVADVFCGTGSVSAAFSRRGYNVIANDVLSVCVAFAQALLLNASSPPFRRLAREIPLPRRRAVYAAVIEHLNALPTASGFFVREYSPFGPQRRHYFTVENAGRIDAIRTTLAEWKPLLTTAEYALLRVDLIRAANSVANTAGTYGCYLKRFKARALQPLRLSCSPFEGRTTCDHQVRQTDANRLVSTVDADIVYADPPYTKRQYAAYYHVLETLAIGDEPSLIGSTGLRPWRERASSYCYRRKAASSLAELVNNLRCKLFLLSYSEDGHISHAEIMSILRPRGRVTVRERLQRRYKSSGLPHRGRSVVERLYTLKLGQ
jgi:adenine-specific DNA-methyltransferase